MASASPDSPNPLLCQAPPKRRLSGSALASMILGILAIPLNIVFFSGMLVGIIAIVVGILAVRNINQSESADPRAGKAFAIAGIILGTLSILLGIGCGVLLFHG